MASSNTDSPGTIYRWIERKPLTEAVSWTSKEKFWLTIAMCHYGTHDWKSVAQVLRHGGEPYRPREWFTPKSCERQFKILVSNLSKEAKLLPFLEMMQHIAEGLKSDYVREVNKSRDTLKLKYCNLFSILNRVKQGNLSRNEVVSLYSQARRNEIEGKQYMDQLMTRQNASLASENSNSGLIEEPIKWNTPSAPLLTSLLRSRNTIPANRTATTITSLLQSPGGTSRTRSGKLLTLTPSSRTSQGTPTLSKLLEAPANPYIPSPPQTTQKNKLSVAVVTEKLANTSRKENSQSISLNKVRVDNMTTLGSFNQINKSNLSASKKQISKSPVSAVKNGSKANLNVVNLLSDSENEEDKNTCLKSSFGDKKDTTSRVEPRATRSQTRAEGGFKQFNDTKLSDGKKERENLRQQSGGSQIIETHLIDDDIADIDQIEVEPLSSIQDEVQTQTSSKMIGSSLQKPSLSSAEDNLSTNNKVNISKETINEISEETSISLILTPKNKNFIPDHHCLIGNPLEEILSSELLINADNSSVKSVVKLRKDSMSLPNTLATSDEKLLKQQGVIELKATNIRCVDNRSDSKMSYNNQPIVVVNKIKKPFNIKLTSEQRVEDIQVTNADVKKPMRLNNSSQNVVEVIENNSTVTATDDDDDDAVIIVEDNITINDNNKTTMKTNELSSNIESQNLSSIVVSPNISCNSRSSVLELDEKKNKNDKTSWNVFGKPQNSLDSTKKQCHQDSIAKGRINSNISETNNKCIKELDFDFDQSISQTSLAELYNGVEEIVEMHSFDNEELNSLIECGSLDSNETEEHRNTVSIDQGDSSVSESDSTIGAFDTFAQITRVRQKSSTSKEIKLDSRELKTTNQEIKHLKESFCQSNKIEDDQSSPASVTGIPVLQGVISDVMNQIDLNSVASLATSTSHIPPSNDVVEILSSDDEMNVKNFKARPLNEQNKPIGTQDKEKEEKSSTFKEAELVKLPEVESKMYKSNNTNCKISTIDEPIDIEMPPCIVVKSHNISVADRMKFDKILAIKTEIYQNEMEYDTIHDTVPDEIIVVNDEEEDKKPLGIAVKSAKERLIKETERMKREAEERKKKEEERKRKEDDERKKKEEDERKKKENDDRMKRENEERMKKEEELKKKELENILLNERKKKEDEDRKIKEDKERKKKEDEEKKIKALQETMRKEKEQQILQKIDEEERQKNITKEKLNEFHLRMKNDMNNMKDISLTLDKIVVVKEEIIDECVDDILEEIIDNDELEEDMILNDEYLDDIIGRINMSTISQKSRAMKNIFKRRSELAQIRDYELRWKEESIKSRIKLKECMQIQDLLNKREKLKLSAGDVSAQKGYTRIQPQTMINILELQNREAKEVDDQRYKEIDVKKIMEAERQRAYEIISKEAEMKRVKSAELERIKNEKIKRAEEVETKKSKEVELRKNIIVKETEIKGLEKKSVLKKMNEPENNRSVGHTEFKLIQNYAIILPDILKQSAPRYHSNVGQKLSETRKVTAKEDFETFNLRERGIKKSVGSEGKKVIESKLPEIKMVTRTRGLKAEEKLKETNVSKSMSTKLRPQIKPSGSTSSISSSTIAENLSISSYEYKKQTKNVDDGNKRNSSSNIPYDNKHLRDLNVDSSDIVRKENSNHDAIGTPRTRTRSSSFKQKPFSETKSSKQSQDNATSINLKESIGTKAIFTAAHHFSKRHFFNKHLFNDDYDGQTLVPVVMLDKNEISLKASQKAMGYILKQHQNTSTHNQVQKPIETIKQLEKPPPKKRGRKRRIDVQNEKLQESIRSNELTPKNFRKTRTSIKEVEPLAKRTRRSLGLLNTKKESGNKRQSVYSHKFKKEFVDKSVENIKTNKKVLKFVFNNICERSKYILSLNKETKDLPPKCLDILKFPVELQKIKRKITAGKITSIAELKFNLLILSHNVLMTKRSDSKVFSDASNFQSELEEYFRSLKNIVDDQNVRKCQDDSFYIHNNCYNKRRYPGSNYDPFDAHITINKKTIANIYKYIDNSSDESSGSESDSYMPPKKKRKKNVSDSSSSESD